MTRVTLNLSDDLKARLETCAAAAGHASIEQYLQSVLHDLADDVGGPASLSFDSPDALEQLLTDRVGDTASDVEATPQFWTNLKQQSQQRRSQTK